MSVSTTVVSRSSLLPSSTPSFRAVSTTSSLMALSVADVSRLKLRLKASCLAVEIGERSQRRRCVRAARDQFFTRIRTSARNTCAAATVVRPFEAAHQIVPKS